MDDVDGSAELRALRALVENSTDMLARHAPDGTYLQVSPSFRALLGYEPDELVGRTACSLVHPDDRHLVTRSRDAVVHAAGISTAEFRVRHHDGHWVWVETTSHTQRDPHTGAIVGIFTSARDITTRRQAEVRLRDSEERFRLAMANAPIGMALIGLDGSWLEVNDRVCQIVGRSREELRGLTFQDLTHPEDLDADLTQMQQLFVGEIDHYTMEKRYLHAAGHLVWVLLSAAFVRDAAGTPLYGIAQIQDITDRKHREAELRRANTQLAASNAELERFAAVASHDLRSPLAMVRSLLDLTLTHEGDQLPHDSAAWLERARVQTDRSLETIDALLVLARASHEPLTTTDVEVAAVIDDVVAVLGPTLDDAGTQLSVEPLPTVAADRTQLRLVFQNLLSNAVRFRHPDRPLAITVSATDRGDAWELTVADNGVGFDPEDAEVIFEPFGRTHEGAKLDGAGIGLATCRRIVERHGGRIRAAPLDPGARISFTLPKVGHHPA